MRRRSSQHIATWIACLAILMAALAPTISHALAAHKRAIAAARADICTVSPETATGDARSHAAHHTMVHTGAGTASATMATHTATRPDSDAGMASMAGGMDQDMNMADCPYCVPHGGVAGLPPAAIASIPLPSLPFAHPALFYRSPAPLFVWSTAQSRAPPGVS